MWSTEHIFFYLIAVFAILVAGLFVYFSFSYFRRSPLPEFDSLLELEKKQTFGSVPVHFTKINGVQIRYVQLGQANVTQKKKPDLVLVHGLGASMYCWRNMVHGLAQKFNVTALDLPGFGLSDKNPNLDYGLNAQTERVIGLLDHLNISRFYLVGHSMGGALAAWLGQKYPSRIIKISLLAPAFSHKLVALKPSHFIWGLNAVQRFMLTPELVRWIYIRTCLHKTPNNLDEVVQYAYLPYHKSPEALVPFLKSNDLLRDPRLKSALNNFSMPVQVIYGDQDRVIGKNVIANFLKINPQSHFVSIANSGHMLIAEDALEVNENILKFFDV
jgi:pimeloyl-ACP methyl ester carboxylesterase